jgi:two-component system phosphate regulon sensor histidine kinase PhoR
MRHPRLLWRIYLSFLLVTCAAYVATAWHAAHSLREFHQKEVAANLLAQAQITSHAFTTSSLDPVGLDRLCRDLGQTTHTRYTVILPDGRVIADSEESPARMANHADRPEIIAALRGETGRNIRFSATLRQRFLYLAIPIRRDGAVIAAMRASLPLTVVDRALAELYRHLAGGGLLVAALFALLALYLSYRLNQPLQAMREAAERFARGDLTAHVPVPSIAEFAVLAQALNQMAVQLNDRILTIMRQRNEQTAVLTSMTEGVLAVDLRERVIEINPAAARLLALDIERVRGLCIQECIRHPEIHGFVAAALAASEPSEAEIVLRGATDTCLQFHGTSLLDGAGKRLGSLIVLNDITRLKKLETMRRDFVANVSHELKTPITAIRGYLETLTDAMPEDHDERRRFLAVVSRHADRLQAIIDDLLSLSRIEFDVDRGLIELEGTPLEGLLQRVVQTFMSRAREKGIVLTLACEPDLSVNASATLLEQAVGNLVDNAVKYSGENSEVTITAGHRDQVVEICVVDHGPGIERQHLARIFERFYRVDQGRTRTLGGTGLGLAIVRHIAIAHHGTVTVESTPGSGSSFRLNIPAT